MKITALEEYGLRCMLLLAKSYGNTLTLSDFSQRERLSIPYAGKLLMILKKARLVKAVRGRNGGYALSKAASEIYLKEIFYALGEPVFSPSHCQRYSGDEETCVHTSDCSVRDIWIGVGGLIENVMERITLADIASGNLEAIKNIQAVPAGNKQSSET